MVKFIFHPLWQAAATIISLVAAAEGFRRFRMLHLGHKTTFNWKKHVRWGGYALAGWLVGWVGGFITVKMNWPGLFVTGPHALIALIMAPLLVFGLGSGLYLNRVKKKRQALPLAHGLNNIVLILLALAQAWTGWRAFTVLVLN
ncbi:MAG: DUF4079 domain-containing protein [Pseudomonadota bacterium]